MSGLLAELPRSLGTYHPIRCMQLCDGRCCASTSVIWKCRPHVPARWDLGSNCLAPGSLQPTVRMPQPVWGAHDLVSLPAAAMVIVLARYLQVVGEDACPGIKQGGFPSILRKKLPILARGDSIPGHIEVDITGLKIGQRITLPQIQPLAGVEIASQVQRACRTAFALLLDATALRECGEQECRDSCLEPATLLDGFQQWRLHLPCITMLCVPCLPSLGRRHALLLCRMTSPLWSR